MTDQAVSPAYLPAHTSISCPCCGGPVARVGKRLLDRILSPLRAAPRRYRCTIVTCGWKSSERAEVERAALASWSRRAQSSSTAQDAGPRRPGFRR